MNDLAKSYVAHGGLTVSRTRSSFVSGIFLGLGLFIPWARANDDPNNNTATAVRVVESSEEHNAFLEEKPAIHFGGDRSPGLTILVDDSVRMQTIDGFGASLTDSSAWLLWNKLSEAKRKEALQKLFDPQKGIGLSLLRQPMGASDFALEDYSYDDLPLGETDPGLAKFSIAKDERYIIPILREALGLNPNLKIIGTPWSPPGWMKTSQSMIMGALLPSGYTPLAQYFVKFVQAYEKAGVPIYAITPQNEPLYVPTNYPGMNMTAGEQAAFLRDNLGPALRAAQLKTKVLIFDHNWDLIYFPIDLLNDPQAAAFASGIAIHCYGGNATAQSELHTRFPDKDIWLTECSAGDWQKSKSLEQQVRLIIDSMRNWSRSVILWNLALDQYHEPHLGGCSDCRGIMTVKHDAGSAEAVPTIDFTALGHASKYVRAGAVRIDSNTFGQNSLEDVAFRNPDGAIVLLVLNSSNQPLTFNIAWSGRYAVYTLKGGYVATFRWESAPAK
jgi:glucosylceramidase